MSASSIVLENDLMRLVLSPNCTAESLVLKEGNTECLFKDSPMPFFSIEEERPFNNEIKLAHPAARTTFGANRVRMEDGRLIVGFDLVDFEAVVDVRIAPMYIAFSFKEFLVKPDSFGLGVLPILPPVSSFRLVQLPVIDREHFGEWLNVSFDDTVAVNVLSASPYPRIASESRRDHRILLGETLREIKLRDAAVALIVSRPDQLLDAIDSLEADYGLPRGVQSRRSSEINRSYFWVSRANPKTIDDHIEYATKAGLKFMSFYYSSIFSEPGGMSKTSEYGTYRKEYPNGIEDLKKMLAKIKAAGITPGLHILHTHAGMRSHYLTPVADHRLNKVHRFTLSQPLSESDTDIFVEESPEGSPVFEKLRVIQIGGELISYESFTTERPYRFTGCKRGFNDTYPASYPLGMGCGILDVSEFGGNSVYIDQRTSLPDEIADQIAEIYDAGFEFIYYDGSEGTNPPFDVNVGLAQWRVYRKLNRKPLFCEGAAKSHFSWHMLSGGNAFDVWSPDKLKQMVIEHPFKEAVRMKNDFTRLNFGWWSFRDGMRPDIIEFGTSRAAAWDCPGSFISSLDMLKKHPRSADVLEVLRRWEDARRTGFLTKEMKEAMLDTSKEHTLLINGSGDYELVEYRMVKSPLYDSGAVTAFVFERMGKAYATLWCNTGDVRLTLPGCRGGIEYRNAPDGEGLPIDFNSSGAQISLGAKSYLISDMTCGELEKLLSAAEIS